MVIIIANRTQLLNSVGVLFLTQGILVLQPTHTSEQKRKGAWSHLIIMDLGLSALIGGLVVIEYNKISSGGEHWHSAHGIMGLATYIVLAIQATVGFTMFVTPKLYGSVDNAKAIWKYHRMSGYLVITLMLATVCAAVKTDFNVGTLKIQMWALVACSVLILIGIVSRIKKQKLGL